MFTKTKSTPTDTRTNPFRDPLFKPKMTSFPTSELRRTVERIIDQYAPKATVSATEEATGNPHLPTDGHPGDILQLDSSTEPQWLRKLTVSERSPNDSEGEDGDICL